MISYRQSDLFKKLKEMKEKNRKGKNRFVLDLYSNTGKDWKDNINELTDGELKIKEDKSKLYNNNSSKDVNFTYYSTFIGRVSGLYSLPYITVENTSDTVWDKNEKIMIFVGPKGHLNDKDFLIKLEEAMNK